MHWTLRMQIRDWRHLRDWRPIAARSEEDGEADAVEGRPRSDRTVIRQVDKAKLRRWLDIGDGQQLRELGVSGRPLVARHLAKPALFMGPVRGT